MGDLNNWDAASQYYDGNASADRVNAALNQAQGGSGGLGIKAQGINPVPQSLGERAPIPVIDYGDYNAHQQFLDSQPKSMGTSAPAPVQAPAPRYVSRRDAIQAGDGLSSMERAENAQMKAMLDKERAQPQVQAQPQLRTRHNWGQ